LIGTGCGQPRKAKILSINRHNLSIQELGNDRFYGITNNFSFNTISVPSSRMDRLH
jgi:hypothetical protein